MTLRFDSLFTTITDIDECAERPCDMNADCTNTEGSFTCACMLGYSGDGLSCTCKECTSRQILYYSASLHYYGHATIMEPLEFYVW